MRPKNKNMTGPKELLKQETQTCLKHAFHVLSLLSNDQGHSSLSPSKEVFYVSWVLVEGNLVTKTNVIFFDSPKSKKKEKKNKVTGILCFNSRIPKEGLIF